MTTPPKPSSYGIYVRFRRSRLALRRGVPELADALALAEELRASRFHDRGDIFVVKEPEGTVVELPSAPPLGTPAEPERLSGSVALATLARAPDAPVSTGGIPRATRPSSSGPPAAPPGLARILQLGEQVDHLRLTLERARTAQERFVRALAAADGTMRAHWASSPPDAFRRNRERLTPLLATGEQTLASFERVGAVVERRLQRAWAEATGVPCVPALRPAGEDGATATRNGRR